MTLFLATNRNVWLLRQRVVQNNADRSFLGRGSYEVKYIIVKSNPWHRYSCAMIQIENYVIISEEPCLILPVLGVIGGSGLYAISSLKDIETLEIDTLLENGAPIVVGTMSGKRVAFIARHGIGHTIMPTEVNYRANIYA